MYINRPLPPIPQDDFINLTQPNQFNQDHQQTSDIQCNLQSNSNFPDKHAQRLSDSANIDRKLSHRTLNIFPESRNQFQLPETSNFNDNPSIHESHRNTDEYFNLFKTDKNLTHSEMIDIAKNQFLTTSAFSFANDPSKSSDIATEQNLYTSDILTGRSPQNLAKLQAFRRFMSCDEAVRRNNPSSQVNQRKQLPNNVSEFINQSTHLDKLHSMSFDTYGISYSIPPDYNEIKDNNFVSDFDSSNPTEDRSMLVAQASASLKDQLSRQRLLDEEQLRLKKRAAEIESLLIASKNRLAASLNDQKLQSVFNSRLLSSDETKSCSPTSSPYRSSVPYQIREQNQSPTASFTMQTLLATDNEQNNQTINNLDLGYKKSNDDDECANNNDEDYVNIDDEDDTIGYDEVPDSQNMIGGIDDSEKDSKMNASSQDENQELKQNEQSKFEITHGEYSSSSSISS